MRFEERRTSFGSIATLYDRVRPGYPVEAVRWALSLLGTGSRNVLDLGSGTGLLTRVLVDEEHRVIAVEPDEAMRHQCAVAVPEARVLGGIAENIPLAAESVDAVIAGQSYHWFASERAHIEIARVLTAGGVFVAIWNDWDASIDWIRQVDSIIEGPAQPKARLRGTVEFGPLFERPQVRRFRHTRSETPASLLGLIESKSVFVTAPAAERDRISAAVYRLCWSHPDLSRKQQFDLPYIVTVIRATKVRSVTAP